MQTSAIFADRLERTYDRVEGEELPVLRTVLRPRREDAIAARIDEIKEAGESVEGIAIESGLMTAERVDAWLAGKRSVDDTAKLSAWLDKVDEDIAERTGEFIMTPGARRYLHAFEQARAPRDAEGRRGVAMVFGASGTGKTETAKYAARMDGDIVYILADGEARTWTKILAEVARSCGHHGAPNTGETLKALVSRLVPIGGLLIFDHAHMIRLSVMEQLLSFPEEMGIGIAFIGNLAVHTALRDKKLVQLTSRANGATVIVDMPDEKEVDAHLEPLGISGRKEREFCQLIGRQDGGLRFLYATVRKARQLAVGMKDVPLDVVLLKIAAAKVCHWIES